MIHDENDLQGLETPAARCLEWASYAFRMQGQ